VPRDRWGRPLIIPGGGGAPVAYTRVSTLAKTLDGQEGLTAWKERKVAEGLLRRPDLLTRVSGALALGDPDTDRATKRALNTICGEAREAAAASAGASTGTGLHALTQAIDTGRHPANVPEHLLPRLAAYIDATADYEALDVECFVVNDTALAAGTFDRLYLCPDGRVRTADVKTGKSEVAFPLSTTVQISIYANGLRYDPATGVRTPLHPDLDLTTGLLIHLPATGGCQVVPLDLELGWRAAQVAAEVHQIRKWRAADLHRQVT
jgi:hypothetical protein